MPSGETEAHIFYMAYTLDGVTDAVEAPGYVLLQRRPGFGVDVGAHGRHGSAQPEAACRTAACRRRRIS